MDLDEQEHEVEVIVTSASTNKRRKATEAIAFLASPHADNDPIDIHRVNDSRQWLEPSSISHHSVPHDLLTQEEKLTREFKSQMLCLGQQDCIALDNAIGMCGLESSSKVEEMMREYKDNDLFSLVKFSKEKLTALKTLLDMGFSFVDAHRGLASCQWRVNEAAGFIVAAGDGDSGSITAEMESFGDGGAIDDDMNDLDNAYWEEEEPKYKRSRYIEQPIECESRAFSRQSFPWACFPEDTAEHISEETLWKLPTRWFANEAAKLYFLACVNQETEDVQKYLDALNGMTDRLDMDGNNAAHYACLSHKKKILKMVARENSDLFTLTNDHYVHPLKWSHAVAGYFEPLNSGPCKFIAQIITRECNEIDPRLLGLLHLQEALQYKWHSYH